MSTEHAREKPASSPTLSVCLIVKNEAERLPSAVESVKGVATEVVVVDTGSGDDTVPVARSLGARVLEIQWQDDFSHARNASLEAATGDWILCLDADEKLAPGQQGKLRRLLSGRADACYVMIRSPMAGHRRGQTFVHAFQRLFRNRPQYRYQGRVHEQIYPALSAAGARLVFSDLEIDHSGYALAPHFQESKLRRNLSFSISISRTARMTGLSATTWAKPTRSWGKRRRRGGATIWRSGSGTFPPDTLLRPTRIWRAFC